LYGLLPRQYVAAEFLERLEVFRGANTFLNGAAPGGSGIGGEFNLVPKRAPDVDVNRLTVGYENQTQGYAAGDLSRRFGEDRQFGVRVNAARRDGEDSIDNEDLKLSMASIGADYHITARASVENVTDKDYWSSVGGEPGANYLVLAEPRTFKLSLSVDL
jgi:iron complex outermembrane recepter protein